MCSLKFKFIEVGWVCPCGAAWPLKSIEFEHHKNEVTHSPPQDTQCKKWRRLGSKVWRNLGSFRPPASFEAVICGVKVCLCWCRGAAVWRTWSTISSLLQKWHNLKLIWMMMISGENADKCFFWSLGHQAHGLVWQYWTLCPVTHCSTPSTLTTS